jgi:hypothetical protein
MNHTGGESSRSDKGNHQPSVGALE